MCTCTTTDRGTDVLGCPVHEQWDRDHPGGVISDEEEESMARYADEACREEGHR